MIAAEQLQQPPRESETIVGMLRARVSERPTRPPRG